MLPEFDKGYILYTTILSQTPERLHFEKRKRHPDGCLKKYIGTGQICYSTVGNQFLNWLPAICHRHIAFSFSNLARSAQNKKDILSDVLFVLEVPARFELANNGFADRGLTTWLRYHMKQGTLTRSLLLERVTRLELATSTLARWRSTG